MVQGARSEEVTELRRKLQAAMNEVASLKAAMTSQVEERAIENGISELTGREAAAWGEALLLGVDIEAKRPIRSR